MTLELAASLAALLLGIVAIVIVFRPWDLD